MIQTVANICERSDVQAHALPLDELLEAGQPVVLRGLVSDWALTQAGRRSAAAAIACLGGFYNNRPIQYSYGSPDIAGRVFYTDDFRAINCEVRRGSLTGLLDEIAAHLDAERREALFDEVVALGAQCWMTGTDTELFAPLRGRAQILRVTDGTVAAI